MNEKKKIDKDVLLSVSVLCILFIVITSVVIYDTNKSNLDKLAIKTGLEQCPDTLSFKPNDTIWVKDCVSFLKEAKEINDIK